jgi:hypothetical protein
MIFQLPHRLPTFGFILAGLLLAASVRAQTGGERHTFDVLHERDARLEATFNLALGSIQIGRAARGHLFQAQVDLEDENLMPALDVHRRGEVAVVHLGFEDGAHSGLSLRGFRNRSRNTWQLNFDNRTPLDLRFTLGLADADLDFTGLTVDRLKIVAGMANTRLVFDRRNRVEMVRLDIEAGAARFTGESLGNARFHHMSFSGGAGSFELDFTGAQLPRGARADIDVGVARLRIRIPENKAVVLTAPDSWLTRIDVPDGYARAGRGVWHSPQVRRPEDAFHLNIKAGMGRVTCETVVNR